MECYCAVGKMPIRLEGAKPQTAMVHVVCGFVSPELYCYWSFHFHHLIYNQVFIFLITAQPGRGPPLTNQQRRTVFDRLDSGPPRDRGFARNVQGGGPRDQRTVEVEVNPQDVPRGKRYFMVCGLQYNFVLNLVCSCSWKSSDMF